MQIVPVLWNSTNCYNNHRESCTEVIGWQVNVMLKRIRVLERPKLQEQRNENTT